MSDKVVPFYTKAQLAQLKKEAEEQALADGTKQQDIQDGKDAGVAAAEVQFDEVMKANKAKADKLAKERAGANKSVLRSYRIKH